MESGILEGNGKKQRLYDTEQSEKSPSILVNAKRLFYNGKWYLKDRIWITAWVKASKEGSCTDEERIGNCS